MTDIPIPQRAKETEVPRYLYALEITESPIGAIYEKGAFGFHCTVMQWHETNVPLAVMQAATVPVFRQFGPIMLTRARRATFGPNNAQGAWTISKTSSLRRLHFHLLNALNEKIRANLLYLEYIGSKFRPHVSDVGEVEFGLRSFKATHVLLVRSESITSERQIVDRVELGA